MKYLKPLPLLIILLLMADFSGTAQTTGSRKKSGPGRVRRYYIAAEQVVWDFAPSRRNLMANSPIPLPYIETAYAKIRYIEYTDSAFKQKKPQPEWLGLLGPIIRAEVGDTVEVHFLNRTTHPLTIHPHGLRYSKKHEGAVYAGITGHSAVPVNGGQQFTYTWIADESSGPGPGQPSSVMWPYHSHIDEPTEVNAGLVGPIIVTARGKARPDGSPRDVDQEFVTLFMVFDQQQGQERGMMHAINGYIFGNLPGLVVNQRSRVRWHLFAMGSERDIHTAHWHGKVAFTGGQHLDVVPLLPAQTATVDMIADNPGSWMFHCHVADHMEGGMMALFTILQPQARCPVSFGAGNFWKDPHHASFSVTNSSSRPIKHINFASSVFIRPQNLVATLDRWTTSSKQQEPGETSQYESPISMQDPGAVLGWTVSPVGIEYQDGTVWKPQDRMQCVHVYWRDGSTQQPRVLPPLQNSEETD
jgi:manganese oxidase